MKDILLYLSNKNITLKHFGNCIFFTPVFFYVSKVILKIFKIFYFFYFKLNIFLIF